MSRSQLDDYKAAERNRESKRDRSARQRPEDDGAQAAKRKRAKREQLLAAADAAARADAAAKQALRPVQCSCLLPSERRRFGSAAARDRDWQDRVREGRFVEFRVRPARDVLDLEVMMKHKLDMGHRRGAFLVRHRMGFR